MGQGQNHLEPIDEQLIRSYSGRVHRLVEGQHFIATRALVDDDAEQALLEALIETSKPPAQKSNSRGELHYLLYTPFRYPPLRAGGRFHQANERSLFYASDRIETAMAEIAYARFCFMKNSEAKFAPSHIDYTEILARIATKRFLHLTRTPFEEQRAQISDPNSYQEGQKLGRRIREIEIEAIDYFCARGEGVNYALFSLEAFAKNRPEGLEAWKAYVDHERVEFSRVPHQKRKIFTLENFLIEGKLPQPG